MTFQTTRWGNIFEQKSKNCKISCVARSIQLPRKMSATKFSYFVKMYGKIIMAFVTSTKCILPICLVGEIFSYLFVKMNECDQINPIRKSRTGGYFTKIIKIKKISNYWGQYTNFNCNSESFDEKKIVASMRYIMVPEKQLFCKIRHLTKYISRKYPPNKNKSNIDFIKRSEKQLSEYAMNDLTNVSLDMKYRNACTAYYILETKKFIWSNILTKNYWENMLDKSNIEFIDAKYERLLCEDYDKARVYKRCSQFYRNQFEKNIKDRKIESNQLNENISSHYQKISDAKKEMDDLNAAKKRLSRKNERIEKRKKVASIRTKKSEIKTKADSIEYFNSLPKMKERKPVNKK